MLAVIARWRPEIIGVGWYLPTDKRWSWFEFNVEFAGWRPFPEWWGR